jgi:hypothetical protein
MALEKTMTLTLDGKEQCTLAQAVYGLMEQTIKKPISNAYDFKENYKEYERLEKLVDKLYEVQTPEEQSEEQKPSDEPDYGHYNDDVVDMHIVEPFCLWVLVASNGDCKAICYDSNFFSPRDLLDAYTELIDHWAKEWEVDEDEKQHHITQFKTYLLRTGAEPEDLED